MSSRDNERVAKESGSFVTHPWPRIEQLSDDLWYAVCSCGWESEYGTELPEDAGQLGLNHLSERLAQ